MILPEVQTLDDKIKVIWSISSASTSVAGKLLAQIQFEKIFDDNSKNVVWQSNIMEFTIQGSLASADEVFDQNPTLFQQWEEKVSTAYSDVSASVKAVQVLENQVQTAADKISAQERSILQIQTQVSPKGTEAQSYGKNALTSASAAQKFATQAKTSETNALAVENLAKGYSNISKTYADAAEADTQSRKPIIVLQMLLLALRSATKYRSTMCCPEQIYDLWKLVVTLMKPVPATRNQIIPIH